jgi:hypothetical protein
MPTDTEEPICVRCGLEGCPSSPFNSPPRHSEVASRRDSRDYDGTALPESSASAAAPCGLLAPDPAFQELDAAELLAMVPCAAESVLRRGRAVLELGRRAADDPALLTEVAALIRDPANRRLITIGPLSVSQPARRSVRRLSGTSFRRSAWPRPAVTVCWAPRSWTR